MKAEEDMRALGKLLFGHLLLPRALSMMFWTLFVLLLFVPVGVLAVLAVERAREWRYSCFGCIVHSGPRGSLSPTP